MLERCIYRLYYNLEQVCNFEKYGVYFTKSYTCKDDEGRELIYYIPNFYEVMCDFQYDQLGEENKKKIL